MSHGTRIRPDVAAWAVGTVVDPAEFDALDEGQFVSINGDDGGTWAPSAAISIGGSGLELTGAGHLVAEGGTLTIKGTLATSASFVPRRISLNGATGDLDVNSGGDLNIRAGGGIFLESGALAWHYSGSTVNQLGTLTVGATGIVNFANGSQTTFAAGSLNQVNAALNIGVAGGAPVGGSVQFNGAAGFAGGYASFVGPDCLDFGSTATGRINGILIKQAAGRITNRIIAGANPGSGATQVYSPADADTIIADGLTGAPIYELSASALHGDRITIVNRDTVDAITVAASVALFLPFGTSPCKLLNASGNRYSATFEYSDGTGSRPTLGWYLVQEVRVP